MRTVRKSDYDIRGHPGSGTRLYVEELTKMLLESDLLREETAHYVLTGPLSEVTIPATLHDALMARLDRVQHAKEVAQFAAVVDGNSLMTCCELSRHTRYYPVFTYRSVSCLIAPGVVSVKGLSGTPEAKREEKR